MSIQEMKNRFFEMIAYICMYHRFVNQNAVAIKPFSYLQTVYGIKLCISQVPKSHKTLHTFFFDVGSRLKKMS